MERRLDLRHRAKTTVYLACPGVPGRRCVAKNVSSNGVFVETETIDLLEGTPVELIFGPRRSLRSADTPWDVNSTSTSPASGRTAGDLTSAPGICAAHWPASSSDRLFLLWLSRRSPLIAYSANYTHTPFSEPCLRHAARRYEPK